MVANFCQKSQMIFASLLNIKFKISHGFRTFTLLVNRKCQFIPKTIFSFFSYCGNLALRFVFELLSSDFGFQIHTF